MPCHDIWADQTCNHQATLHQAENNLHQNPEKQVKNCDDYKRNSLQIILYKSYVYVKTTYPYSDLIAQNLTIVLLIFNHDENDIAFRNIKVSKILHNY